MAVDAARSAGELVHGRINDILTIEHKAEGNYNLVTEMDLASEELIKSIITGRLGPSRFLAEESGGDHDLTGLVWVVDPIDGTVNYAHRVPIYTVSIAAVRNGEPLVGVVFAPGTGELFTATKGGGAFFNGRPMRVSKTDDLLRSVVVTGFPYNVADNPYGCIDSFIDVIHRGIAVRRLGSAALDLAYVADGRFDAFWEVSLNEWDVAAAVLMIHEAGGRIASYAPDKPSSIIVTDRILATNGLVHDEMMGMLRRGGPLCPP